MSGPEQQIMMDNNVLLVRQKLDKLEIFCPALQKRNKYKIAGMPDNNNQDFVDAEGNSKWDDKAYKNLPQVLTAKEESDFCCRCFCMNRREFTMDVTAEVPGKDPLVYKFERPFKCTLLACCIMCNPQEIHVKNAQDQEIGMAQQDWRCVPALCGKTYWKTMDPSGATQYNIEQNLCCNANMCAPSFCCPVRKFDIYDANMTEVVGKIENIFPECTLSGLLRMCNQTDQYKLVFPPGSTPDQRATLLANLILIEFMLFEKSDNNEGGMGMEF